MEKSGLKLNSLKEAGKLFIEFLRKGNGMRTVGYQANGEASDWMLANFGIVAASPELGTNDRESFDFFIEERPVIYEVLEENLDWILFCFKKMGS